MSRTHLCGYDLNLTYPQRGGHFPTLNLTLPTDGASASRLSRLNPTHDSETRERTLHAAVSERFAATYGSPALAKRAGHFERREAARAQWKRDLSGRANGTIDPHYGCDLLDEVIDYAVNFTFPWCECHRAHNVCSWF